MKTPSALTLLRTFASLLALLAATVLANRLHLGAWSVAVALTIALAKAGLIALFFMEVRYGKPVTWLFAGAALVWFLIMMGLTMNDYQTRPWSQQNWKDAGAHPMHIPFPQAKK